MSISTVPVGQPLPGASFGQSVARFFRGYVLFSGRASRSEFWWAMLFTFLISLVAQVPYWISWVGFMLQAVELESAGVGSDPSAMLSPVGATLGWLGLMFLVNLALMLPMLAVMWRRLQDAGFHGAFALLSFVGFSIVPLVMCSLPSSPQGARFDRGAQVQAWVPGQPAFEHQQQQVQAYVAQPDVGPGYGGRTYGSAPYGSAPAGSAPYSAAPDGSAPYAAPATERRDDGQ